MTALAPSPGTIRVAVDGTLGTRKWANIFHCHGLSDAAKTQAEMDDIATLFEHAYRVNLLPPLASTVHVAQVTALDLTSDVGLMGVQPSTGTGGSSNPSSPASVCAIVNWRIALRYRGGHPRTYLPGVPENEVDENGVLLAGLSSITAVLTSGIAAFLAELEGNTGPAGSITLCTVHYVVNNVAVVPPAVPTRSDIFSGALNPVCGSQRRRVR